MPVWSHVRAWGLLVLALAAIGGCNDNDLGIEKRHANQPPATLLTSGPPDSTTRTEYRVHLYWTGSDADGRIDHYDYILVDHPAADDDIDPSDPNAPNRVVVEVPRIDDRRWRSTTTTDTLVLTRADTLRVDPRPPPGSDPDEIDRHNSFVRRQSFERWHTFFVRAVDNEGLPDPDPDYRSFNSRTLAPMVRLLEPVESGHEFHGPPTIVFNWDGTDDDGDGVVRTPIASRWVCLPTRKRQDLTYSNFPDTLYQLPPSAWSPWRAWDARDGSGRQAVVRDLRPASATEDGLGFYFFAVQAMDEAGAVTPVFDWTGRNDRNNATPILVTGDVGPRLEMVDPFLGQFDFIHGDQPQQADIAVGQTVRFCWQGDAASYGGRIVAYRYGWDIRNPGNDQEWDQNWSEQARCVPPRSFSSGSHVLMVEARDNAEAITRGRIELTVRQITRNRDLLLVDDSRQPQGPADDLAENRRWIEVIDSLRTIRPFAFDPNRDVYEVALRNNKEPPIALLFDYKTVIWNVVGNSNGSALRRVARLIDQNEPGRGTGNTFNYLNLFIANGGEIWVTGYFPTLELAPIAENRPSRSIVPDNITNWNPKNRGDQPDSVGAGSFLYRMGIEAVDIANGSIVPDPRSDVIDQGCIGFRRAGGPGGGTQTYVSTRVQNHEHQLEIPGSDVDLPPADGVTYLTSTQDDHAHTVFLSASQLVDLRRGVRVIVDTDSRPVPVPHRHTFELEDRVGRWGAPAFLQPDDRAWPLPPRSAGNPRGGRSGIEIFNMPDFLVLQTPRLDPPPGRILTLYEFASLTPADRDHSVLYPTGTADEQPALILSKGFETDLQWTRAYCGFEPWRLQRSSHLRLAEFILLQHMRVGLPDVIP